MKKLNYLWAIFIVLAVAFISCSKETDVVPNPNDTIDNPGTKVDSVIVEVTLQLPECVTLSESQVKLLDPAFPDGLSYQYTTGDKRTFTFISTDKKLIGTDCICTAILTGSCGDTPANLIFDGDVGKTITLKKGLNQATLAFYVRP